MDEPTITATIKIGRDVTIDSTKDWIVEWRGEKYIMPIRKPQGTKGNSSLKSNAEVTFRHWAVYQLQRWMFHTIATEGTSRAVEKYIADVKLNLKDFCALFSEVLAYYYGEQITLDLNPNFDGGQDVVGLSISYTLIWDVLKTLFDSYGASWRIEPRIDNSHSEGWERYVIKVGYEGKEIEHIFEYGHEGAVQEFSRQNQSETIRNMLLGRGGSDNLPFRYFKGVDENNPQFREDPDWVEELKYVYFDTLRGATFRSYIQGWKAQHNYLYPSYRPIGEDKAYSSWAYLKGLTDEKFNPVEYVKDDESIANYGELLGYVDDDDSIYPSIQGSGHDVAIAVEQIKSDAIEQAKEAETEIANAPEVSGTFAVKAGERQEVELTSKPFTIKEGMTANLLLGIPRIYYGAYTYRIGWVIKGADKTAHLDVIETKPTSLTEDKEGLIQLENVSYELVSVKDGSTSIGVGVPAGEYYYRIKATIYNTSKAIAYETTPTKFSIQLSYAPTLESSQIQVQNWANTFEIWVDNIWGSEKQKDETDDAYARRVWQPILGDKEGNEAKVLFASGDLAISDDYEFTIVDIPAFDDTKTYEGVSSHWRIRLAKSDAEFEVTGKYIPSTQRQGKAGDKFVFLGIDMPHNYTLWAEEALDNAKKAKLEEVKDVKSSLSIKLDRIKINGGGAADALINQINAGDTVRVLDKQFVTRVNELGEVVQSANETRSVQSVTITYREATDKDAALNPDVEIELADKFESSDDFFGSIDADLSAMRKQIGSISNISGAIKDFGDKRYLRKDGVSDVSLSPTNFRSLVTFGDFRRGLVGGKGVGIYVDANGNWVVEADCLNVRQDMQVNNLVVNQAEARGGMIIDTAAYIQVSNVIENEDAYLCYFDTHNGTIANLFKVDDVAYCQRWNAENKELKFYKRRVIAIGQDYIAISKTEDVNGFDIPEIGDVIIHYGNYTDKNRQFVKVSDVVGGGYERFIEGLDSVNAQGEEFYFVGRENELVSEDIVSEIGEAIVAENDVPFSTEGIPTPSSARWFVGDHNGANIEYKDNELSLNKVRLSVNSMVGEETITDFVSKQKPNENLVVQSDKQIVVTQGMLDESSWVEQKLQLVEPLIPNEEYTFSVQSKNANGDIAISIIISEKEFEQYNVRSIDEQLNVKYVTFTAPIATSEIIFEVYETDTIYRVKLEKGNKPTAWNRANYLERALLESTTIDGGLIATSLIQLGYTIDDEFVVQSGINGVLNEDRIGKGIAFWAGGDIVDAEEDAVNPRKAKTIIRHDGTGYMANNTIRFKENQVELGDSLVLHKDRLEMQASDGGSNFVVKNTPTGYGDIDSLENVSQTTKISYSVDGQMLLYRGTSQMWVTAKFDDVKRTINSSRDNGKVKVNISMEWLVPIVGSGQGVTTPTPYGFVTASLVKNDVVIAQFNNSASGNAEFAWRKGDNVTIGETTYARYICGAESTELTIAEAGKYEILIACNTGELSIENSEKTDIQISQNTIVTTTGIGVYQTIQGTDSFATHWGEALLAVSEQGAIMRFGKTWFKVDDEGITYSLKGGATKQLT